MTREGEVEQTTAPDEYAGERDMERFWREIAPREEPLGRRWFLPSILFFMVASVPWYLPTGFVGEVIGGLPVWVWTALGCSVMVSAITAFVAFRAWHDDE